MQIIIKGARMVHPLLAPQHDAPQDIFIANGMIEDIAPHISREADLIIERPNLHVSIGWLDIFTNWGEPGFEYRETSQTGAKAAAAGGFTDIMVLPQLQPITQSKAQVEYLKNMATQLPISIHPVGAVTQNLEGKALTEMYDMDLAGAIAFSDGSISVQNSGIMLKALQYVLAKDKTIIQKPEDQRMQPDGLMHEGITSTQLGLPGKSELAEELMVARDIELLKYTGSKLHLTGITTAKSIDLIESAKNEGLAVTCSTTPYHLFFCDEDLSNYDSNLKVFPPLRTSAQREFLRNALINGFIDAVASHHQPLHQDEKNCEFQKALPGMETLEVVFGVIQSILNNAAQSVRLLAYQPRKIFNMSIPEIAIGARACLTLFDPDFKYHFEEKMIKSQSKNNAFVGKEFTGKVFGIINNGQVHLND